MSIGSIGSLRGALGTVDTQPSPFTPKVNVRSSVDATPDDAPAGAGSTQAAGSGGFAPSATLWEPWPPYVPTVPIKGAIPVVRPLPPPPGGPGRGDGIVVSPLPPRAIIGSARVAKAT